MRKKGLTIYYIATNTYAVFWQRFLNRLYHFMPSVHRHVILLSDTLSEYNGYEDNEHDITVEYHHIDHYPWPIIALFKHRWILEFPTEDDYIYYFNANADLKPYDNELFVSGDTMYVGLPYLPQWLQRNPFNPQITYMGGGFFGGRKEKVIPVLEWCNRRITEKLAWNIIDDKHDETIINEYAATVDNNVFTRLNLHEFLEYTDKAFVPEFKDNHPYIG